MKLILINILSIVFCLQSIAQDSHFSHIHASPLNNNPAWVGVFNNDIRVILNYRNQWATATTNYNTVAFSIDSRYLRLSKKVTLNVGLSFLGDSGGDLNYGTYNSSFHLGTQIPLDRKGNNFVSIGTQLSFIKQHLNFGKVKALQYEPLVYSYDLQKNIFDLSLGIGYFLAISREKSIYAGVAFYHINQPNVSVSSNGVNVLLYKRFVINAGANWEFKKGLGVQPSIILYWQGPHREINFGSFFSFKTGDKRYKYGNDKRIYFGAWARFYASPQFNSGFDALILSTRYDINRVTVAFSFDFTFSKLTVANSTLGGPELSLIYTVPVKRKKFNKHKVFCPKF